MNELSVFDVQKALRDHAMLAGHDVTQSNRQLHFRDNVFGMVARRHLNLAGDLDSILTTYLMMSEKPLISSVRTQISPREAYTTVSAHVPHTFPTKTPNGGVKDNFYPAGGILVPNHSPSNIKVFENPELLESFGLDVLRKSSSSFFEQNPTIPKIGHVEALQNHITTGMLGPGVVMPHNDMKQPSRLMDSEDFRNFDIKSALNNLMGGIHPHAPHSNKITVGRYNQNTYHGYEYDPETEQLNKVIEHG